MPKFNSPSWAVHIDEPTAVGIIDAVSRPRLSAYGLTNDANSDQLLAVAWHARNIVLSESLYPLLHMLEVVIRNRIHDAFSIYYKRSDWYDLAWLRDAEKNMIQDARNDLIKKHKPETPDNIVAALSFGFWCAMFNGFYETASGPWPFQLKAVLPRVPKSMRTRKKILERLEEVRRLRNRIFHHEPIVNISNLAYQYRDMTEMLGWFSPESKVHIIKICRFNSVNSELIVEAKEESP